jgi:hypothetical protein
MPPSDDDKDDEDDADPWLRPVWEDDSDETAAAEHAAPALSRRPWAPLAARPVGATDNPLLAPLAAAQDALARLDARAEAAPAAVCAGLIARLAWREAAGWLAACHAWVHPADLALRDLSLTGRFDTAGQLGRARASLPATLATSLAGAAGPWSDPTHLAALAGSEQAVTRALALARRLRALPRRHDPLADVASATTWLAPLGAGNLDPQRFTTWRQGLAVRSAGRGRDAGLPPLLRAAAAAGEWMEAGIADRPDPLPALAVAALLLARPDGLRVIPLPFWAAWPNLGHGEAAALPRLRGDGAASWMVVFLTLVAEAACAGARELDRLQAAAAAGTRLIADRDRRSRLPAALEAVLAVPALTPKALAGQLAISQQAATRLLVTLADAGIVREVTGRKSFRAFAA